MNTGADNSTSPYSESTPTAANGSKRKNSTSEGNPQPEKRSKRNRYISIACNECKRRKIKCNGETPCQRCGNLQLDCVYAPNCCTNFKETDDFKHMNQQIATLQQQVELLYTNLNSLRSHAVADDFSTTPTNAPASSIYTQSSPRIPHTPQSASFPAPTRPKPVPKHPRFHGPTSAAFNIGVAKSSLQNMGITSVTAEEALLEPEYAQASEVTPLGSPKVSAVGVYQKPDLAHSTKDPIWLLTKDECLRLVNIYRDEVSIMYPMLDMDRITRHANMLFAFVEAANRSGLMQIAMPGSDAIQDDMTNILKLILACAMVMEASGRSELARRLFDNVKPTVDAQLLAPPDPKAAHMLILTAIYYFHKDEEQIAWRMIGLASRVCMEIGLHRSETYSTQFATTEEADEALRLFWSLYVLDRRWSLGVGMPFAVQDADIDPTLPKPDEGTPYLNAMIAYSAIGSKLWRSADAGTADVSEEDRRFLDFQVQQWTESIPPQLQYVRVDPPRGPSGGAMDTKTRSNHRLRILLKLRGNQMRILIYRPVLHTAGNIMENLSNAHKVVDIAKESIRILHAMNAHTDLYKTQQVIFNYFLISALAVLFLAVSHAPAHFAERCKEEFYMALDLVRGFSSDSYVSKRLWRTIKILKEVGPKLGLIVRTSPHAHQQQQQHPSTFDNHHQNHHHQQQHGVTPMAVNANTPDAHSSAAVAMAGLAGHNIDEMAFLTSGSAGGKRITTDSPNGMANDLTSLFEAAGGYSSVLAPNGFMGTSTAAVGGGHGGVGEGGGSGASGVVTDMAPNGEQVLPSIFGNEDELGRILKDLF